MLSQMTRGGLRSRFGRPGRSLPGVSQEPHLDWRILSGLEQHMGFDTGLPLPIIIATGVMLFLVLTLYAVANADEA